MFRVLVISVCFATFDYTKIPCLQIERYPIHYGSRTGDVL
jgi:hypothetical protein